jgi:hypothetical protein
MAFITTPTNTGFEVRVAASNASAKSKRAADFICSGSGDQTTIGQAVAALPANGGKILFSEGTYTTSTPYLIVNSNIDFEGLGTATVFQSSVTNSCFASSTTAFSDIIFEKIMFVGPVSNTVSVPTRARTTSGAGIDRAIKIDGSLDQTNPGMPVITNITIRNCIFRQNTWTPISLFGISGKTMVLGCEFYNNQDVGFVYNQEVTFNDNYVYMSADNGVSISRGNLKVACVGNTFENICRDGIWISGFSSTEGPQYFSVVGNTIRNIGQSGIRAQDAPKYGVISGNEIHKGYFRGASDEPNDLVCNGIYVAGYPVASAPAYTDPAIGISVTGNHIYQAPRYGILVDGSTAVDVKNNLIQDTGTQYYADGVTVIPSNITNQNVGIRLDTYSTCKDIQILGNTIVDERTTPYCNWAMYPYFDVPNVTIGHNTVNGCRNPGNLAPVGINGFFGQGVDGAVILDGTVTVSWASKSGSVYTLTRDIYCSDLTINSGVVLSAVGFMVHCSGVLTLNGTYGNSGAGAVGSAGGTSTNGQNLRGGQTGATGGTGAGAAVSALTGGMGGNGGAGGNSGATNGSAGGIVNLPAANLGGASAAQRLPWSSVGLCQTPTGTQGWAGGGGGGAGAGDGTNAGGGGGQGGGVVLTNARYLVISASGLMKTGGGAGGNGAGGNAAGGGGGAGGLIIINTTSFTGTIPTATTNCPGGAAGTSQGTATAASAGSNGVVYLNIFS